MYSEKLKMGLGFRNEKNKAFSTLSNIKYNKYFVHESSFEPSQYISSISSNSERSYKSSLSQEKWMTKKHRDHYRHTNPTGSKKVWVTKKENFNAGISKPHTKN